MLLRTDINTFSIDLAKRFAPRRGSRVNVMFVSHRSLVPTLSFLLWSSLRDCTQLSDLVPSSFDPGSPGRPGFSRISLGVGCGFHGSVKHHIVRWNVCRFLDGSGWWTRRAGHAGGDQRFEVPQVRWSCVHTQAKIIQNSAGICA